MSGAAPDIMAIAQDEACIPAAPPIVLRCLELLRDPNSSIDELVTTICSDPGLAADVVRLANSVVYGLNHRVTNLDEAVIRMGFRRVRELVITHKLMETVNRQTTYPIDRTVFWRWSVITAMVAARLTEGVARGAGSQAFLAGLLADVGVIILNRAAPVQYAPVAAWYGRERLVAWLELERTVSANGHATLGAEVLSRWGLGEELCEAVRWHHVPPTVVPERIPGRLIAAMLWVANELTDALWNVEDNKVAMREASRVFEQAGLEPRELLPHLRGVEQDVLKLANALRIPITSVNGLRHFGPSTSGTPRPSGRLGIARVVNGRRPRR